MRPQVSCYKVLVYNLSFIFQPKLGPPAFTHDSCDFRSLWAYFFFQEVFLELLLCARQSQWFQRCKVNKSPCSPKAGNFSGWRPKLNKPFHYSMAYWDMLLLFSYWVMSDSFVIPPSFPPWIAAHQAPLSIGFPRQGNWSGLPVPSPGDLPDPGIKPRSPVLQVDSLPSEPPGKPLLMLWRPLKEAIKCFGDFLNPLRTQRKWMKKFQTPFSALPLNQF